MVSGCPGLSYQFPVGVPVGDCFQTVHSSSGYLLCQLLECATSFAVCWSLVCLWGVLGVEHLAVLVAAAVCDDSGQGSECIVRALDLDVSCLACLVRVVRVKTPSLRTATARATGGALL